MNDLETQIMDISESALEELFNETPDSTVNADTLIGGKKNPKAQTQVDTEDETEEEEEPVKKPVKKAKSQPATSHIEDINFRRFRSRR
jgi:hypothetical protein